MPPTADEIRFLIKKHWREHSDPSEQSNAEDEAFLDVKVAATQVRLRHLIRDGVNPQDAENQALREVAFTE